MQTKTQQRFIKRKVSNSYETADVWMMAVHHTSPFWELKNVASKEAALVRNITVAGVVTEITLHLVCSAHRLHPAAQKALKWPLQ